MHNKPLADKGLTSYRYPGLFGWIMIGASSHQKALAEANRSLESPVAKLEYLQVWDGEKYISIA